MRGQVALSPGLREENGVVDKRSKILIAVCDTREAENMLGLLDRLDFEVCALVGTSHDTIRAAERSRPEMVLMDLNLPGAMDALETGAHIQRGLDIPIIYLATHADADLVRRARWLSSFGYLIRPFSPGELRSCIEKAIRKHERDRCARQRRQRLRNCFEESAWPIAVFEPDTSRADFVLVDMNREAEELFGRSRENMVGGVLSRLYPAGVYEEVIKAVHPAAGGPSAGERFQFTVNTLEGPGDSIQYHVARLSSGELSITRLIAKTCDTAVQGPKALPRAFDARGEITTICSFCRKIKEAAGVWVIPERYFHERFGLAFSHGLCPECARKEYGDFLKRRNAGDPSCL